MPTVDYGITVPYREVPGPRGLRSRPCLAVLLTGPGGQVDVVAQVDSGSYYVVFNGELAGPIGLDLNTGERVELGSPTGGLFARLHEVTLEVEGYAFRCGAAFTEEPIARCLLGREGFFAFWQVGFRHHLSEFYLSPDPLVPFPPQPQPPVA